MKVRAFFLLYVMFSAMVPVKAYEHWLLPLAAVGSTTAIGMAFATHNETLEDAVIHGVYSAWASYGAIKCFGLVEMPTFKESPEKLKEIQKSNVVVTVLGVACLLPALAFGSSFGYHGLKAFKGLK